MKTILSLLLSLVLFAGSAWAQVITTSGEEKQLCRVWDGTDVALVDAGGALTCNLGATDNAVLDDIADGIAVTGTVTANLSATDNAVLDDIADGITATVTDGAGALNVIVDSGAITATVTDGAGALNVIVDSGTITANLGATDIAVLDDIADGIAVTGTVTVTGDVDVASSALPTGASTSANQSTIIGHVDGIEALLTTISGLMTGASGLKYTSAGATEDEHAVKATAGTLYSITITNTNAAARYIRCENDTAANTAPGSETPELDLAIPGATTGAGFTTSFPQGFAFSTALTCWLVTGAADTDVAEVAANEIKVFYTFK